MQKRFSEYVSKYEEKSGVEVAVSSAEFPLIDALSDGVGELLVTKEEFKVLYDWGKHTDCFTQELGDGSPLVNRVQGIKLTLIIENK